MNLLRKLRALFRREKLDREMDAEMRAHIELQTERNIAAGMLADEARYAALRQFGNLVRLQERAREQRAGRVGVWLEQFGQDVRYAFRQLARSPGFTLVVVLTLALGIGATTAIYSVVDKVILNPVGGSEPERLVQITQLQTRMGKELQTGTSPPVTEALMSQRELFAGVAWSEWAHLERQTDDFINQEAGAFVSWNFFDRLEGRPLLGRAFFEEEAVARVNGVPAEDTPIVLSYAWWRSQWGGDESVLGRVIEMSGRHFTVVGVMPAHFQFPHAGIRFWIPVKPTVAPSGGGVSPITTAIAKLSPGIRREQVQAWLDTVAQQLMDENPANTVYGGWWRLPDSGLKITLRPLSSMLQDGGNWEQVHQTLLGLFAAIGFVLLIVCANVANLTLARVERRRHELAIRVATGASRVRLMRQLLTENLLLALLGGTAGIAVAGVGLKVLMTLNVMPRLRPMEIDGPLLGVALLVSTLTGLLFGFAPMWRGAHVRVNALLADGGMNATAGMSRSRYRGGLVVAQIAITIVLLVGAGLMLRSVNRMLSVNPGFDPENLLLVETRLPSQRYDMPKDGEKLKHAFIEEMMDRFRTLPGVKAVGVQQTRFFEQSEFFDRPDSSPFRALHIEVGIGAGDVFRATRMPMVEGREFRPEDIGHSQNVVLNETLARQMWPGESALGKRIRRPGGIEFEVIGVVGDARFHGYTENLYPAIYHPFRAAWSEHPVIGGLPPDFVIRTESDPAVIIPFVRRELKAVEPSLMAPRIRVARQVLFDSTSAQRTYRNYLGLFAAVGLLLSALGVYGVLAFAVTRRTREIGIRIAIGAEPAQVRRMILGQGARLVATGLAAGLLASLGLTKYLQSQLFEVSPTDPMVMATAMFMLAFFALFACWLPARRAARVDPVVALRAE